MKRTPTSIWLTGIGTGAGLMYLLDPSRGTRRRAMLRDQFVEAAHKAGDAADVTSRDVANRLQGAMARVRSRLRPEPVDDEVLVERVRAKLGRVVTHPGSIEVTAQDGCVALHGPVLAAEEQRLLQHVAAVQGVRDVENRLEVYKHGADIPGLQGGPPQRLKPRFELAQRHWMPATRLMVGLVGGGFMMSGWRRRGPAGALARVTGIGLLARAATNMPFEDLLGLGAGRDAIRLHKEITIVAPVEVVFEFWANYQNFPRFMSHVREVRSTGEGRSHWIVGGPAGVPVEWDAEITDRIDQQLLAWKTVPGSVIQHSGIIRFEPNPDGSTRVNIRLAYNPGLGAVGHVVASLFGADPKHQMDEDLVRVKTFLEQGIPASDAAKAV